MALWSKLLTFFAGAAADRAAGEVVEPAFLLTKQNASARRPYRTLDPNTAAAAAAMQFDTDHHFRSLDENGRVVANSDWGATAADLEDDALRASVGATRFNLLKRLNQKVPPWSEALTLWRRGRIDEATVNAILKKEAVPEGLWPALKELIGERLDAAETANAVQQGFLPNAGLLPGAVSGPPFDIPTEEVPLDTLAEFAAEGVSPARAKVMAYLSGNPPGPVELANMELRGQIPRSSFFTGIREGRTKTKWGRALLYYLTHPLLTPGVEVRRLLKGWQTKAETDKRMALYGYTPAQVQDWYEAEGRPAAPVQMFNAIARKAPSPYTGTVDWADFDKAIQQSDIRPEYAKTLRSLYHAYPPLFQLRRAVTDGSITPERALAIMHIERYEDQDAQALVKSWTRTSGAGAKSLTASLLLQEYEGGFLVPGDLFARLTELGYSDVDATLYVQLAEARRVKSARDSTLTTIRGRYVNHKLTRDEMLARLGETGVPAETQTRLVEEWDVAREATLAQLTPAQVKKAYFRLLYTRERAVAELEERGYATEDANTLLDE